MNDLFIGHGYVFITNRPELKQNTIPYNILYYYSLNNNMEVSINLSLIDYYKSLHCHY